MISGKKRCEVRDRDFYIGINNNDTKWYGWSTYIPVTSLYEGTNGNWIVFAQWHEIPDSGELWRSPSLSFRDYGDSVKIKINTSTAPIDTTNPSKQTIATFPHQKGVWNDYIVKYKIDPWGSGIVKVWQNESLVVDWTGAVGYNDAEDGTYFKMGIYNASASSDYILYHDNYRRGDSYNEVNPANSDVVGTTDYTYQNGVGGYSGTSDIYLASATPDDNTDNDELRVDGDNPRGVIVKWDVSNIPSTAVVTEAKMFFNIENATINTYGVYEMKRDWVETEATWNQWKSAFYWDTAGAEGVNDSGNTLLGSFAPTSGGSYSMILNNNGKAVVQEWIDGTKINYGFLIKDYSSSVTDYAKISRTENVTVSHRPKLSITTTSGVSSGDITPPYPNPIGWYSVPASAGTASITMTARTATDVSGVEYFFDCQSAGCNDSGWQNGTIYLDTGLSPNTNYTYRVKARDKSTNQNETSYTSNYSATTLPLPITENFVATEDTYTQGGVNGNDNHGGDLQLQVKQSYTPDFYRKSYFKFDLGSEGISGTDVSDAKLKLFVTNKNDNAPYTAYQYTDSWSEDTLTWNNAAGFGSAITNTTVIAAGQYFEWDITDYVRNQLDGSDDVVSIALYDPNSTGDRIYISSSEGGSNQPLLEITHVDRKGPCSTCKSTNEQPPTPVKIVGEPSPHNKLQAYPNPVTQGILQITIPDQENEGPVVLSIYDMKAALRYTQEVEEGEKRFIVYTSEIELEKGMYIIQLQSNQRTYSSKVIIHD